MATSIFFNGRLISVPGSYTEVDASGLEQIGLGATGIVAVLGEAVGGKPQSAITESEDIQRVKKPETARAIFKSGPLREVADMLFAPAKDADIPSGAVEMVPIKVNPATQASATFANAYGNAMTVTSEDYGAFTNQINVSIANATGALTGKLVTIVFEDVTESGDGIGGDAYFTLKYVDPGTGWDTMTGEVDASGNIIARGTRGPTNTLIGDVGTQLAAPAKVEVLSSAAGDTSKQIILYGTDAAGTAVQTETLTLNATDATTVVTSTLTFTKLMGARATTACAGNITVRAAVAGATVFTLTLGASQGLDPCSNVFMGGTALTLVSTAGVVDQVVVVGISATGASQVELITLTAATPVTGTATWSEITYLGLATLTAAKTVTISGIAAQATAATQVTLQKAADYFNARGNGLGTAGFTFAVTTGKTAHNLSDLDDTVNAGGAVSILTTAVSYYSNLYDIIYWINNNSDYITAAKAAGAAGGFPTNTTAAVFLSGGGEGTTLSTHWQNGLNLLKQIRVNSIVVLTGDPAVHAMVDAHCAYMCGFGRSERDGFVGLQNTAKTDVPTKAEVKSQIIALNSRHIRAFGQYVDRYNTDGDREEFPSYYQAAIAAGMQAGSPVGTSLTHKYANVLSLRQDTSWNPTDDSEEMIQAGLCFMERVDGIGRRVVRNITTHLTSNNIAFIEGSVNEAVNYAVYNFRTNMETAVGKRGFSGTVNAAKGVAIGTLGLLKDEGILVATRSLDIELIVDVLEISVEIAPVIPVNFVKSTIHLITITQTATE